MSILIKPVYSITDEDQETSGSLETNHITTLALRTKAATMPIAHAGFLLVFVLKSSGGSAALLAFFGVDVAAFVAAGFTLRSNAIVLVRVVSLALRDFTVAAVAVAAVAS